MNTTPTTPIVRTELMQELMDVTAPQVGFEAVMNGFTGAWERLIAKALKNMWTNGSHRVLELFDYLGIPHDNISQQQFDTAALLIYNSKIPSEQTEDIGIE